MAVRKRNVQKRHRVILGSGYYCLGVDYMCKVCFGSEGDWVGLVERNGKRIRFVDKFPRTKKKFKLIVEY